MDTKKSFLIYDSWATLLFNLPTEQAGQLIKAICGFQLDQSYELKDPAIIAMYAMIKPQMVKDAENYEEVKKQRSEYGKIGAKKRWSNADAIDDNGKAMAKDSQPIAEDSLAIKPNGKHMAKMAVSDSVSVSVSVSPNGDKNTPRASDETEPPAAGLEIDESDWSTFWKLYPKKTKPGYALSAWNNAVIGYDPGQIIQALKKTIDLQWSKWPKNKLRYIPTAGNWLRDKEFLNEIEPYIPEMDRSQEVLPAYITADRKNDPNDPRNKPLSPEELKALQDQLQRMKEETNHAANP